MSKDGEVCCEPRHKKAYRQLLVSSRDSILPHSIWFRDPKNKKNMVIFRTATCDFGDSQASLALRVAQDKYIVANCRTKLGVLASQDPIADNYLFSGRSKEEVLEGITEPINLHKKYGMELKSPSHNLGNDYDYLGKPDDTITNALGITWYTVKDTLQPIFHYHLSKKVKGIKKACELVGLSPEEEEEEIIENIAVTRSLLSQITPQSFDLSWIFLGHH